MRSDGRIVVVLLGLFVLVLIFLVPFVVDQSGSPVLDSRQFGRAIARYEKMGLLNHDLVSSTRRDYRLSSAVLDYSGEKTFAKVRAELNVQKKALERNETSVEQALSFRHYVSSIATRMTAGTSFQGRVNVNAVPKSNHVTIIFLGGDPEHLFSHFSDSLCAYVGKANTVLCNAHNVNAALEVFDKTAVNFTASIAVANPDGSIDVSPFKNLEIFRQLLKQNFLTWLIGHELGHAVLHSRNADRETQALHFDLVFDKREQEADLFVIKAIESDPVLRAAFPVMLLEYIEQKFREMYRSQHYVEPSIVPARGGAVKTVTVNPGQLYMRLFVRAVRIMDESLQRNPKALEEATYAVINGQLAYVGSYKFPPYYKFIKSRVVFDERSLYLRQLLRSWRNLVGAWRADKPINQPGGKNED